MKLMLWFTIWKRWTESWVYEQTRLIFIDRVAFYPFVIRSPFNTHIWNLEIRKRNTHIGYPRISLNARSCVALNELWTTSQSARFGLFKVHDTHYSNTVDTVVDMITDRHDSRIDRVEL